MRHPSTPDWTRPHCVLKKSPVWTPGQLPTRSPAHTGSNAQKVPTPWTLTGTLPAGLSTHRVSSGSFAIVPLKEEEDEAEDDERVGRQPKTPVRTMPQYDPSSSPACGPGHVPS